MGLARTTPFPRRTAAALGMACLVLLTGCVTTVAPTGVVVVAPDRHSVDVIAKEWRRQHPAPAKIHPTK